MCAVTNFASSISKIMEGCDKFIYATPRMKSNFENVVEKLEHYKEIIKGGNFEKLPKTEEFGKTMRGSFESVFGRLRYDTKRKPLFKKAIFNGADVYNQPLVAANNFTKFLDEFYETLHNNNDNIFAFFDALREIAEQPDPDKVSNAQKVVRIGYGKLDAVYKSEFGKVKAQRDEFYYSKEVIQKDDRWSPIWNPNEWHPEFLDKIIEVHETLHKFLHSIEKAINKRLNMMTHQFARGRAPSAAPPFPSAPPIESYEIFPNGLPKPEEIKQRYTVGDCGLIEVLSRLADKKPEVIRDCFTQSDEELRNAKLISIRLFEYNPLPDEFKLSGGFLTAKYLPRKRKMFTIIKNKIDMQGTQSWFGTGTYRALWPLLLEEAVAMLQKKMLSSTILPISSENHNIAQLLGGISRSRATIALTGKPAKLKFLFNNIDNMTHAIDYFLSMKPPPPIDTLLKCPGLADIIRTNDALSEKFWTYISSRPPAVRDHYLQNYEVIRSISEKYKDPQNTQDKKEPPSTTAEPTSKNVNDQTFDKICRAIEKNKVVTCAFNSSQDKCILVAPPKLTNPNHVFSAYALRNPSNNQEIVIIANHAYGIVNAFTAKDGTQKILTLENPHKEPNAVVRFNKTGKSLPLENVFDVSYDDLVKYHARFSFSSNLNSKPISTSTKSDLEKQKVIKKASTASKGRKRGRPSTGENDFSTSETPPKQVAKSEPEHEELKIDQ